MKIFKNKIDVVFLYPILIRYDIIEISLLEVMTCRNILTYDLWLSFGVI